jgi:hypothetical protein
LSALAERYFQIDVNTAILTIMEILNSKDPLEHRKAERHISGQEFMIRAGQRSREMSSQILFEVVPNLHKASITAHPLGFWVVPLDAFPALWKPGDEDFQKRLHYWEKADRSIEGRRQEWLSWLGVQNTIHRHGWLVHSRVAAGTYRDVIMRLEDVPGTDISDQTLAREGWLRRFVPDYDLRMLTTDGSCVRVVEQTERVVFKGEGHFIGLDVAHATKVPEEEALTVVVNSNLAAGVTGADIFYFGPTEPLASPKIGVKPGDVDRIQAGIERLLAT